MQDIQELLAQQDQKYQAMLSQVMQRMMSMQQGHLAQVRMSGLRSEGAMWRNMAEGDAPMESNDSAEFGWTSQEI